MIGGIKVYGTADQGSNYDIFYLDSSTQITQLKAFE